MKRLDNAMYIPSACNQKRLEVIVFGEDWGAHPSSTQHLIKRLMPYHDIVWINSLGLRRPKLNIRDIKRASQKLMRMLVKKKVGGAAQVSQTKIVHPKAISWPGNPVASLCNKLLLGRQLDRITKENDFELPILWASMPSAIDAIDNYPDNKVVYYVGDDFRALAGVDHAPVEKMEQRLAERADLIIVASKALQNRFPAEKTILVEHGVDYELFANETPRAKDMPEHPLIAGFYGSIHDWLDVDMIRHAAQECPEWRFLFIGDVHINIESLASLNNIEFLGARPHKDLPKYAQHWQASLLPFKDCEQIRACNPLKLKEYLCAGQPVTTTEFPAMRPYKEHVRTVSDARDMISALKDIQKRPPKPRAPLNDMQSQTWDAKSKLIENALLSL